MLCAAGQSAQHKRVLAGDLLLLREGGRFVCRRRTLLRRYSVRRVREFWDLLRRAVHGSG